MHRLMQWNYAAEAAHEPRSGKKLAALGEKTAPLLDYTVFIYERKV